MYSKYILPRLLEWLMKDKKFIEGRQWCIPQASGIVLEIGYGGGANLPYYVEEKIEKLIVLEPNKELLDLADTQTSIGLTIIEGYAENIPLDSSSIDHVIFTWTLCSVSNVHDVLTEIYRVLKVGGKVSFIEHGKSHNAYLSAIQNFITPLWSQCVGGCQLNRSYFNSFIDVGFTFDFIEQDGSSYKGIAVKN